MKIVYYNLREMFEETVTFLKVILKFRKDIIEK